MKTICVDAGHAGLVSDPGAVGVNGLAECRVNLAVARLLRTLLTGAGCAVLMTRDRDEDPASDDLAVRAAMANTGRADIFVSLHCNAAANRAAAGSEVFHHPASREGARLAGCIAGALASCRPSRGVKTAGFYLLRATVMPAVLVEMGFLSNPEEAGWLSLASSQHLLAGQIFAGIADYFNWPPPQGTASFIACRRRRYVLLSMQVYFKLIIRYRCEEFRPGNYRRPGERARSGNRFSCRGGGYGRPGTV
ncbi:MAG: N-acetylmuramoyl-L-alanine amidase [Negativicutes bacterium]|nr:N-acetylmuramoyl-L-alanine amidase [Negativicutes bacterium]